MHHYYFIIRFDAGFTVEPRKGRAVLWPATLDADPFKTDERTHHEARPLPPAAVFIHTISYPALRDTVGPTQALPVTKGTKYAANFWLHQFDYVTAHLNGCTA